MVHEVVADTLGTDWVRHTSRRFDERQAVESLAFLDPDDVPKVHDVPSEVLEVHLTVDCTDVEQVRPTSGLAGLVRSPSP